MEDINLGSEVGEIHMWRRNRLKEVKFVQQEVVVCLELTRHWS